MNGHCLYLVIVCVVSIFLDFSAGHFWTTARNSNFCFWTNSISNGQTHYMFLHQTTVGKERSLVLFDSIWNKENSLVDCITSNNRAVIKNFSSKCFEVRDRPFSDVPDGRFNISILDEPDGPCAALGKLPELGVPVRRTRDLENMDRKTIYQNSGESSQKLKRSKRAWMIPGTLWCGSGNKASAFSDLGLFLETDMCCREHDHCEKTIASFEFGYGVFNTNFFTLSHCDCDSKFRRCLHNANDSMSDMVGYGYFNLLKIRCFEFSQRMTCAERTWWGMCKLSQMTTYALLKDATDYNSSFPLLENDKLDLSMHHTVSFGNLTVTNDLVMSSGIVTEDVRENHSSVSVPRRLSVTVNTSQQPEPHEKTTKPLMKHPTGSSKTEPTHSPKTNPTDSTHSTTDSEYRQTTDEAKTETNSPQTPTDSPQTPTDSPQTPTDSPQTPTDSPQTPTDSPHIQIRDSLKTETTGSPQTQKPDSSKTQTTNSSQIKTKDSPKTHNHPEMHTRQKGKLDTCESYKDLDSCHYQIPALREKFGLRNAEHTTLYHCNCTARLARELAEEVEVDKVHFWLLDFVSQSCFFLPQNCTGSESCSTSSPNDAPRIERWSKGAAVWRHLAAPRRKAKRFHSKRSKRKDSPARLHKKCLRMYSKVRKEVQQLYDT